MKQIAVIFCTRPEFIKLYPLIAEFKNYPNLFNLTIINTGQHLEMLDGLLETFHTKCDYNLKV